MHFTAVLTTTILAAIATAAPAPQLSVSYDTVGSLQQAFVDFSTTMDTGYASLRGQLDAASGGFTGEFATLLANEIPQLEAHIAYVQGLLGNWASALDSATSSFAETEEDVSSQFS
ncbi:hypothetical protein BJX61DRAFT_544000 [Aspergillus egyptiacus]|nr:hypothetical protein BJX61DRAFT_544000 [Aspergillus egyptiacus]